MNNSLKLLLEQVYELEGLLLVAQSRGNDTNAQVLDLIQKKIAKIAELSAIDIVSAPVEKPADDETTADDETIDEKPIVEPTEKADILDSDITEPSKTTTEVYKSDVIDTSDDKIEDKEEPEDESDAKETEKVADEKETEKGTADETDDVDEKSPNNIFDDDDDDLDFESVADDEDETLTLDEVLQRSLSRDLHKAFSLNDRFRYRRELFANNDVEMNDTLNLIESMQSLEEAEDFFYGDLEWDKDSPEVIDFMNVIKNHFYNRSDK